MDGQQTPCTGTNISRSNLLTEKTSRILVLVTSALCLICLSLAIYNAVRVNKVPPGISSVQTLIPGNQITTTTTTTTTTLSQTTTTLSQTTITASQTTTITTSSLFLLYGDEANDEIASTSKRTVTTSVSAEVFGKSLDGNTELTLETDTAKFEFGHCLSFTIFDGTFLEVEHIYYRKVTNATHISDISCLLNGAEVLEAFVFTWMNFVLESAQNELPATVQCIVVIVKDLQTYIIRIYGEQLPETKESNDAFFANDDDSTFYNYENSANLAGKRIINDIKDAPGITGEAPEIEENRGCHW